MTAGVVYEVNLDIDATVRDEYLDWLAGHVAEILRLPGFTGATVFRVLDPPPAPDRWAVCVQYTLTGQTALDAYLRDHAPRFRAEGMSRFGGRFNATRRVLAAQN